MQLHVLVHVGFLEEVHVTCLVCTFTIAIMCACAALHHCIEIQLNYNAV